MTRKSFVVILILSVVVTYGLGIIDALSNPSANKAGLPFKFGFYALFGTAYTNYSALISDIIFWFLIIWIARWIVRKVIKKLNKNKKR